MKKRKAQVTIFIIIAVVIIGAVAGFFLLKDSFTSKSMPSNFEPVYTTFLSCLEEDALTGIDLLGTQAGYIELPDFESGSTYMPFSSHLNLLGNPIPYWYYVSGNNIQKEQVPSENQMEMHLEKYIESKIQKCVFDSYYDNGFAVQMQTPKADVEISDNLVNVDLKMNLNISTEEQSVLIKTHSVEVKSNLGKLYTSALKVYKQEQSELFLENYGVDTLRTYAPVDGTELTCSPLTWNAEEVFADLALAIEQNTLALRGNNNDFSLAQEENKYFIVDLNVEEDVRFLNSQNWAFSYEVEPSTGAVMLADVVGYQEGMGALGFCYVPYHFVYSLKYPVLIQITDGDEVFQFPVAVVVNKNKAREPANSSALLEEDNTIDVCSLEKISAEVYVYDELLNFIDANLTFKCFGKECDVGSTSEGIFVGEVPTCVNGYVIAKANGYKDTKVLLSSLDSGNLNIIMEKLYKRNVILNIDGKEYNSNALITFTSDEDATTLVYPGTKEVEIGEAQYEIKVYAYKNSSIKLSATSYEQCYDMPTSGIGSFFGVTEEECVNIEIPAQVVSNALFAGGTENYYILESELADSSQIIINAESLTTPKTVEDLQQNYALYESKGLNIEFT